MGYQPIWEKNRTLKDNLNNLMGDQAVYHVIRQRTQDWWPHILVNSKPICGYYITHWRIQGAPPAPPQGSRFFCFNIQILRNIATSGVGTPPMRLAPPLREILDPPLLCIHRRQKLSRPVDFSVTCQDWWVKIQHFNF